MIRVDAIWLATEPLDMRAGTETALARVFLTPDAAFKQKRAVDFDYVDFTTPERRRWALERELDLEERGLMRD